MVKGSSRGMAAASRSKTGGLRMLKKGKSGSRHVAASRKHILSSKKAKGLTRGIRREQFPPYFSWIDFRSLFHPQYPRFPAPPGYDWCNETDIPVLPNGITSFVLPVMDQGTCGNCYAVSSANMTSARFAIWGLQQPVRLSCYQLTDCGSLVEHDVSPTSGGCNGGNPSDCFNYMRKYGLLVDSTYQKVMTTGGKYPAGSVETTCGKGEVEWPAGQASYNATHICDETRPLPAPEACTPKTESKVFPYRVKEMYASDAEIQDKFSEGEADQKVVQYTNIEDIKADLFNNGPLVAMFKVWNDFSYPGAFDMHLWPETNNIYIRGAYQSRADSTLDEYIQKYQGLLNVRFTPEDLEQYKDHFWMNTSLEEDDVTSKTNSREVKNVPPPKNDKNMEHRWKKYWASAHKAMNLKDTKVAESHPAVGHAVMIVGWGVDRNVPKYGTVEYWIVQNSWTDNWNDNGYFKIAFSHQRKGNAYEAVPDPLNPGRTINEGVGLDLLTKDDYGGVYSWKPLILDDKGQPLLQPKMPVDASGKPIPLVPLTSAPQCQYTPSGAPSNKVLSPATAAPSAAPPRESDVEPTGAPQWDFPFLPFFPSSESDIDQPLKPKVVSRQEQQALEHTLGRPLSAELPSLPASPSPAPPLPASPSPAPSSLPLASQQVEVEAAGEPWYQNKWVIIGLVVGVILLVAVIAIVVYTKRQPSSSVQNAVPSQPQATSLQPSSSV